MGDVERLIEEVRVFECLWKVNIKAYKDMRAKENAWKSVLIVSLHVGITRLQGDDVSLS